MIQKNWQELIKPANLSIKANEENSRIANVEVEPLERGFGITLGNALRRILLSSLQGAAVTSIKIDSVLHEFSSIPGVQEDVTDLILNIKQIALSLHIITMNMLKLHYHFNNHMHKNTPISSIQHHIHVTPCRQAQHQHQTYKYAMHIYYKQQKTCIAHMHAKTNQT